MNKVQKTAYELIQEDARFIYALTHISQNAKNIDSNYICMSLPYIGLFADGAEQWGKKVKLDTPRFNNEEKKFYEQVRQAHKLFEKSYEEYENLLLKKLSESEDYFYSIRSLIEKILGYYNVGTDLCNNKFCGNTLLCSMYSPKKMLGNDGVWLRNISVVVGELAGFYGGADLPVYRYNDDLVIGYEDYEDLLLKKLSESEDYSYSKCSLIEKICGYYNVGTDLYNDIFCGNTILCSMYIPIKVLGIEGMGEWIRNISIVIGKLIGFYGGADLPVYRYNDDLVIGYEDYHFYKNSPLNMNNDFGFVLFSILCSINYVIEFIENYFIDEIPQKFKFAYLQYYYLCDFIEQVNVAKNTNFYIDNSLSHREFRNCLAHYGLGRYIIESEIISDDVLKGLTNKAFGKDYLTVKEELYKILKDLANQIGEMILK